ncbi:hypothetical protein J4232_05850 [Candidatus Woesearchaeota archaeon]|nr:hypothetical protein [Candidatus Woesearchaeota archaeon]
MKKNNQKKRISRHITLLSIILLFPMTLFLSHIVSAEPQLLISIDNDNHLEDFQVIANNDYYGEKYYPLLAEEYGEEILVEPKKFHYRARLNNVEFSQLNNRFALSLNPKTTTIKIFDDNLVVSNNDNNKNAIFIKQISFCNNNNICEPCEGVDCNLMESSLTCSDCKTGEKDLVCDLIYDGICDPDCEDKDKDCSSCNENENNCYEYNEETQCSEEYNGKTCFFGKSCAEGDGVTIGDTLCCPNSYCITSFFSMNEKKEIEKTEEKQNEEKEIQFTDQTAINKKQSFIVYFVLIGVLIAAVLSLSIYFIRKLYKSKMLVIEIQRLKNINRYSYAEIKVYLEKQGYKKGDIDLAIQQHYLYDKNVKNH